MTGAANVASGISLEVVPLRPGPGLNVTQAGTWKRSTPKAVLQGGAWVPTKKVSVLQGGAWKEVWPLTPVEEPLYMYDIEFEYLPNYEVQFHIKKGWPSDGEEIIFMTSTVGGNSAAAGYCSRDPKFKFGLAAVPYICVFEDRTGVPGLADSAKTITVSVYPKA